MIIENGYLRIRLDSAVDKITKEYNGTSACREIDVYGSEGIMRLFDTDYYRFMLSKIDAVILHHMDKQHVIYLRFYREKKKWHKLYVDKIIAEMERHGWMPVNEYSVDDDLNVKFIPKPTKVDDDMLTDFCYYVADEETIKKALETKTIPTDENGNVMLYMGYPKTVDDEKLCLLSVDIRPFKDKVDFIYHNERKYDEVQKIFCKGELNGVRVKELQPVFQIYPFVFHGHDFYTNGDVYERTIKIDKRTFETDELTKIEE